MCPHRSPLLLPAWLLSSVMFAQQVPDSAFMYRARTPAYAQGKGPVVVLDEAHFNFHTLGGRYAAMYRTQMGEA